ncbi:MAG: hypothetical protein ACFE94_04700 [Candidatus Hodarchaeota archaeon]
MNIDWSMFQTGWDYLWEDPVGWFLELPLLSQIFVIIGIIVLTILAVVLVYYILKGVAYLLYYLFKGLYYLFKGIFLGLYKLFQALYYAISGKPKKKEEMIPQSPGTPTISPQQVNNLIERNEIRIPSYCTECGQKITESMESLLTSRGIAFCFYCGKQFELKVAENPRY